MTRLPHELIGDAYTSTHAWDVLTDLVEVGNRMAGGAGEKEGARIVADAFRSAGLRDVQIDEFDVDGWWRGSSSLRAKGHVFDGDHECIALPGTSAGDVEAKVIDLGYGLPDEIGSEVDGKIAMVRSDAPDDHGRWVHRLEKYAAAVRSGAVGFLYRNHVQGGLPATGEIGWGRRPSPIPAVGISAELGARLARYAETGETTVALSVDCRNEPSTSVNAEGVLGPQTDEEVLVTAHVDAHDVAEGARDNGAGCAIVAEIARLLSPIEDELDTRIRFVTFGSEEIGLHGAHHFVENHPTESIRCIMNIDGAGHSRSPRVRPFDFEAMESVFADVTAALDVPLDTGDGLGPHTDAWPFAERGIPAATVGSAKSAAGRGWGHTHADTLDKLDSRNLRDLSIVFASAAVELAAQDRELPHKSREEIRQAVGDHTETELTFFDRWAFE